MAHVPSMNPIKKEFMNRYLEAPRSFHSIQYPQNVQGALGELSTSLQDDIMTAAHILEKQGNILRAFRELDIECPSNVLPNPRAP